MLKIITSGSAIKIPQIIIIKTAAHFLLLICSTALHACNSFSLAFCNQEAFFSSSIISLLTVGVMYFTILSPSTSSTIAPPVRDGWSFLH